MRRPARETREHILNVAAELFYSEGIRATGIDTVVARAGVAPTTLYRIFGSKDDLAAAYIERCSAAYRERLVAASSEAAGTTIERILAVFDVFADEALSQSCRGCPFSMAVTEFPDPDSPVRAAAVAHKSWLLDLFHGLVDDLSRETSIPDPGGLADQLMLVSEGIYGSVQTLGSSGPARAGRHCVETLILSATSH